jgi:hypothetical protein
LTITFTSDLFLFPRFSIKYVWSTFRILSMAKTLLSSGCVQK